MQYAHELDAVLQETMQRWDIPGLAIGVVQGGEIVHAKAWGVQSTETRAPVTLHSVFCVGSVSKCFVATAVLQLVERGQIDLDAPLTRYLPDFRMGDERYRQITVRQMLSHTSGMPDMDEIQYLDLITHPESDESAAERYVGGLSSRQLVAAPGERFSYSNIAYNVLGYLVARVAGGSFESYMREQVLRPAGMPDSTFLPVDIAPNRLALPHLRSPEMRPNPLYPYHRADAPASFLHTTVLDMCHWSITCLNRGTYLGRTILPPDAYELMWEPAADRGSTRPSMYEESGLGWTLGHFKGVRTISHGGGGFGWTAFLLLMPGRDSAAVVMCNEESDACTCVAHALADVLVGQAPQVESVSWMVPISRALAEGGIEAAHARCQEIKAKTTNDYYVDAEALDSLALQLLSAGRLETAIEVLGLDIEAFPRHFASYLMRAECYLRRGNAALAEDDLEDALSIRPGHAEATRKLERIQAATAAQSGAIRPASRSATN